MKTMYKGDKECMANDDQVELMEKAGWSLDKKVVKTSTASEEKDEGSEPASKRVVKKKPIAKKTEE